MSLNETLKRIRTLKGLTQGQVADALQIGRSTYTHYEKGTREPDIETLQKLSSYFEVPIEVLIADPLMPKKKGIKIPVLGQVEAGIPIEAIENIIDEEEINEELARTGEFFGLKVHGHSMEPKFSPGDIVIVRKQPDIENGQIAIVLVNGDAATIKQVKKQKDGIRLIPLNPAFETTFFSNEEIDELPVTIIGKVVELRCKF